jgi:FkbM family methyltransferase
LTPRKPRPKVATVLEAFALSRKNVFFVQIGSNDADHGDPLRPFVLAHHWSGIMTEPVPYVFERLNRNCGSRPDFILENVAIAGQDGKTAFYYVERSEDPLPQWYDQLGSFSVENILKHSALIPNLAERIVRLEVPCMTFESLCRKHHVEQIDLVHIDAEGYDFEIIKLIDFALHRPLALLYEHKHLGPPEYAACREYVMSHAYELLEEGGDTLCLDRDAVARPLSRMGRAWRLSSRDHR